MGNPRPSLNATTHSVGFTAKLVTVRSVSADGTRAIVVDRQNTQTQVPMLVQRGKGGLPAPGETWLLAQDLGIWSFAAFVGTSPADFDNGAGHVTVSPQPPASPAEGDVWLNSSAGNEISWREDGAWVAAQLGTAALAPASVTADRIAPGSVTSAQLAPQAGITAAQVAFTASQIGGTRVFTGTAQPSGQQTGDLWLDPGSDNAISFWSGGEWIPVLLGAASIAPGSLTGVQLSQEAGIAASQVSFTASGIGGITTSISESEPVSPAEGDLWYDAGNGYVLKQWNGTAWVPYQFGTGAIAAGSVTAELIAANTITAAQIAAGLVYAGIIDGTFVNAAYFIGSVFEGTDFIINSQGAFFYGGTPGSSALLAWLSSGLVDPYGAALPATSGATELTLLNGGTVPASPGENAVTLYADGFGDLSYVNSDDGNSYRTGRIIEFGNSGQLISSTAGTVISGMSVPVTAGNRYHVTGAVNFTGTSAAGTAQFGFGGATVFHADGRSSFFTPASGVTGGAIYSGSLPDIGSGTMTGTIQRWEFEVWVTISGGSPFSVTAHESVAGDSFTVNSGYLRAETY